jgi:APA family basic amino acid/polyamine antiporter
MSQTVVGPGARAELVRRIGFVTAASVVVANMIGAGIFTTSGFLARDLASPAALLLVWVVGGILALAGALSYSELGAALPEAGGEYAYLREAYGPLVGFLSGWMSFLIGFSGAIASTALLFAHYLAHFFPAIAPPAAAGIGIAVGLVWVLPLVHVLGVGPGGALQRWLTIAKVVAIVGLLVAGFVLASGSASHFRPTAAAHWGSFPVSLVFVMFAYSGWNAAAYLGGEIRTPGRTLPLALVAGTLLVTVLYLALNCFYLYALPIQDMSGVAAIAERASVPAFGQAATHIVSALVMLAISAATSAMILAGPRVYFAMARDGVFPRFIGAVHPVLGTPARSIVLQSVWVTLLIVFSKSLEALMMWTGFALVIFSALAVMAVFVLRVRRPELPRPYRVPGYPLVPALYVAASVWMGIFALRGRPKESLLGLLTVAIGVPFYWLVRRERR